MFLARTITRAKWHGEGFASGEIPADAVTADLRTRDNALSFWQCTTDEPAAVDEAALAVAAGRERLDRIEIILLSDQELLSDGLNWSDTTGRTPVADLATMHVDMGQLDYARLGRVAGRIAAAIPTRQFQRYTRARVKALLLTAIEQRRITVDELAAALREEVAR